MRFIPFISHDGFSLLEFIVSVGILILLTLFVLTNFKAGQAREELRFAREEIKSRIRQMQTFARTGQSSGGEVPQGGYGLAFRCPSFPCRDIVLFGDKNGDHRFDENEQIGETVQMADDVFIDHITSNIGTAIVAFSTIAHSPYGEIVFYDDVGNTMDTSLHAMTITFRHAELDDSEETLVIDMRTTVQ